MTISGAVTVAFAQEDAWQDLDPIKVSRICNDLGPIVVLEDEDDKAKLFDLLMYRMQLAYLNSDPAMERDKEALRSRAEALSRRGNINAVKDKMPIITHVLQDKYWDEVTLPDLEYVRQQLRDLMKLLRGNDQIIVYTDIEDDDHFSSEAREVVLPATPQNYLDRVSQYIRQHSDHLVIRKITTNRPITADELQVLQQLLFDGDERGTLADFQKAYGSEQPLGVFVRSILGLDRNAAMEAFSDFLSKGSLTAAQQQFITSIIDHFENEGVIDPGQLYESPYTQLHMQGVEGLFGDDTSKIISIVRAVNAGADVG